MSAAGEILWSPTEELIANSGLAQYMRFMEDSRGLAFADYQELWRWSTEDLDGFWRSIWDFEQVGSSPAPELALAHEAMPGSRWFPQATLNYAEHLLRRGEDSPGPALIMVDEDGGVQEMSWQELRRDAGALAGRLRALGVGREDRIAAYLPNCAEAIVGLIACASLGAIWTICSPEFGTAGVTARFAQLEPKVLLASTGYRFAGRSHERHLEAGAIADALPSLAQVIWVDGLRSQHTARTSAASCAWSEAIAEDHPLEFDQLPFEHPLWVLFSSGTTGMPKGITHSHGGILLEHLKGQRLHSDIRCGDRHMMLASTSWMVWNILVASLLQGASAVLLDGNPIHPHVGVPWQRVADLGVTTLGVGAGFLHASLKAGLRPGQELDLSRLRSVTSTGSPLSVDGFRWVSDAVGADVWVNSSSGGTDVCTAFVGGCPLLPVRPGRLQARCLGVAVHSFDEQGRARTGHKGELVITRPMPSMPIYFWNDPGGERYRESYFSRFPGVWRHGDFIEFDPDGSSIIHGRSDSTLNRRGVRIGSAEIYQVVEALPEVSGALVVGAELGSDYYMPLFLHLADGADPAAAAERVRAAIREGLSPRHLPDEIVAMPGIPHTRTGKKLEIPVKRMLQGEPLEAVLDLESVDDPELVRGYAKFAASRA